MDESASTFLIGTQDYKKATLLIRQLKEAGYPCKIEQVNKAESKPVYEVYVAEKDMISAQTFLFKESYEPDFEGKYAARSRILKKLRQKSITGAVAFFAGYIFNAGDNGNGDWTLLALVAFGIGVWSVIGAFKAARMLFDKPAKKKDLKNQS